MSTLKVIFYRDYNIVMWLKTYESDKRDKTNKDMAIVLITGGNGCVGQHVIRVLQENMADVVKEIRVLDMQIFEKKLEYPNTIPVVSFLGNIGDKDHLEEVLPGVTCVIHVAAYIDVALFPNKELLDEVNRKGTEVLLEACQQENVEIFLYCSSIDVMQGYDNTINGTEDNTKPVKLLFGDYALSKQAAERAVLRKNGTQLPNRKTIRTASLRPMVIYGELDNHFVSSAVKTAIKSKIMVDFSGNGKCNIVYAGNVAWGFACALRTMISKPSFGGEAFLLKDDTPEQSMLGFCKAYFDEFNIVTYRSFIPYWILYTLLFIVQCILLAFSSAKRLQIPVTLATLTFMNMTATYDGSKANKLLGYKPLYLPEECQRRSMDYYKSLFSDDKKTK